MSKLSEKLHWTTLIGEKILLAIIGGLTILAILGATIRRAVRL